MPITYPPAPQTVSGDIVSISRFLNTPALVARRVYSIAQQRFISDRLLTGQFTTQSGSFQVEGDEGLYTDRAPEGVNPGAEYPLTPITTGAPSVVKTVKWGQDVEITDESVSRSNMRPVKLAFDRMVNQMVKTIDSLAMSALVSAITQSTNAAATWDAASGVQILRDVAKAIANLRALNKGYEPDVLVVDDMTFAMIISDPTLAALLPRETQSGVVQTGVFPDLLGITILPTPNGITDVALVADTRFLGGMGDENLDGPDYVSAGGGIQVKVMREDRKDMWRLRCRRVTVPIVQYPGAAWKINNVTT